MHEGAAVGAKVGFAVGVDVVGTAVGAAVGIAVGLAVVGAMVGVAVVGLAVGSGVGNAVVAEGNKARKSRTIRRRSIFMISREGALFAVKKIYARAALYLNQPD